MKFKNNGKVLKVRIPEESGYRWITVKHGEIVDISKEIGLINKFEEVKQEKLVKVKKSKKYHKRK